MSSLSTAQSETPSSMTSPSPTNMNTPSSNPGAVIGALIGVLCVIVVVVLAVYFGYFKRRKQSHSFHETTGSDEVHAAPSFRVLSTWEEAMTSQQKQKDASEYTPAPMGYSTPDLIAGTTGSDVTQNNQYGRLRNNTITSETSNLPTIEEVSDRPLSIGFDNPGFDIGLDDILDPSLFKLRESSREEESDNERNSSKSSTDLEKDVSIITADPTNETTIDIHSEEDDHVSTIESGLSDDHVSTIESGLSDDPIVEIDDVSQRMEVVNDTKSEDIENGLVNADFEMEADIDGKDTSSESPTPSPTPSSDIDNST